DDWLVHRSANRWVAGVSRSLRKQRQDRVTGPDRVLLVLGEPGGAGEGERAERLANEMIVLGRFAKRRVDSGDKPPVRLVDTFAGQPFHSALRGEDDLACQFRQLVVLAKAVEWRRLASRRRGDNALGCWANWSRCDDFGGKDFRRVARTLSPGAAVGKDRGDGREENQASPQEQARTHVEPPCPRLSFKSQVSCFKFAGNKSRRRIGRPTT